MSLLSKFFPFLGGTFCPACIRIPDQDQDPQTSIESGSNLTPLDFLIHLGGLPILGQSESEIN